MVVHGGGGKLIDSPDSLTGNNLMYDLRETSRKGVEDLFFLVGSPSTKKTEDDFFCPTVGVGGTHNGSSSLGG